MKLLAAILFLAFCIGGATLWAASNSTTVPIHVNTQSPDGSTLNGGAGGSLYTVAGVWTFAPTQNGDGNWDIVLNGIDNLCCAAIRFYILNGGVLYQLTAGGQWYSWIGAGPWMSTTSPLQTIATVNLSNSTFTPSIANAVVGTVSVTMSPASPVFSGSLSITGANSGGFHLVGTTLEARSTGTAAGTYSDVNIVATQANTSNSPQQISPSLTGGSGLSVAAITLTNGPPNIPNASPCTVSTCAWIQAGVANEPVSDVYADFSRISTNYSGTFALSGANAGNFAISTSSDNIRNVGHITTNGSLTAGDYSITVTATGASGSNSQNVTVHAVSGTTVACGTSATVRNAANAAGNGATLLFPACTYNWTNSVAIPSNQKWIGIAGQTIFDAGGIQLTDTTGCDLQMICGGVSGTTGVTLANLTFQNYGSNFTQPPGCDPNFPATCNFRGWAVAAFDGWTIRNTLIQNMGMAGAVTQFQNGGVNWVNNRILNTGFQALAGGSINGSGGGPINIIGNEIGFMNTQTSASCDGSGDKWLSSNFALNLKFNYYHDVDGPAFWSDTADGDTWVITGNTFSRIGTDGLYIEQNHSGTFDVGLNVFNHNGDGSRRTAEEPGCGGEGQTWQAIRIDGSANTNAHDNNFSVYEVTKSGGGPFWFSDEIGNGAGFDGNNVFQHNTVNFFYTNGSNPDSAISWHASGQNTSGNSETGNHHHLIGGNVNGNTHWFWSTQSDTPQTFASFQSAGQDTGASGATIDTIDTSTTGCTHVACSGSGIGADGVPN